MQIIIIAKKILSLEILKIILKKKFTPFLKDKRYKIMKKVYMGLLVEHVPATR